DRALRRHQTWCLCCHPNQAHRALLWNGHQRGAGSSEVPNVLNAQFWDDGLPTNSDLGVREEFVDARHGDAFARRNLSPFDVWFDDLIPVGVERCPPTE